MRNVLNLFLAGIMILLSSCTSRQEKYDSYGRNIAITWELTGLNGQVSTASFIFENKGETVLDNSNWSLYFITIFV